jgi:hypothetical protein
MRDLTSVEMDGVVGAGATQLAAFPRRVRVVGVIDPGNGIEYESCPTVAEDPDPCFYYIVYRT